MWLVSVEFCREGHRQGWIQDFQKGGVWGGGGGGGSGVVCFRPDTKSGREGLLSASGLIQKAGGGGGRCCTLQAYDTKSGGGGGGLLTGRGEGTLYERGDCNPPPVSARTRVWVVLRVDGCGQCVELLVGVDGCGQ